MLPAAPPVGNEDANRYSPVFRGLAGWQLYHSADGDGYPVKYVFDEWMPVKIIVSGSQAAIYAQDMIEPVSIYSAAQKRDIQR